MFCLYKASSKSFPFRNGLDTLKRSVSNYSLYCFFMPNSIEAGDPVNRGVVKVKRLSQGTFEPEPDS